jgi:hypothetical protein
MDSYNRGYGAGISDGGENDPDGLGMEGSIGNATIKTLDELGISQADYAAWQAAGFYAVAYEWNGQTVISYRGTDELNPFASGNDITNGWVSATGTLNDQAQLALDFYSAVTGQSVFDPNTPQNVVVTGHSLGGGLAGLH